MSEFILERTLEHYVKKDAFEKPFDLKQVPISAAPITATHDKPPALSVDTPTKKEEKPKASRQEVYSRMFL